MGSRPLIWVGSSKDDISKMPNEVKVSFGHRLREAQNGKTPLDTKPLPQFGKGVHELREEFEGNAYRVAYVVGFRKAIYVLHAFMKKSKSGIGTPRPEARRIQSRFKRACVMDVED